MSQRRLAKLADVGDATVRHIEAQSSDNVETKTGRALATALGCSVAWLLTGEGEAPTEESLRALAETEAGAAQ